MHRVSNLGALLAWVPEPGTGSGNGSIEAIAEVRVVVTEQGIRKH
jgi:hypothetical protein